MFNLKFKRIAKTRDLTCHVTSQFNFTFTVYDGFIMATWLSLTDLEAFQNKFVHMSTFRDEFIADVN